VGTAQELERVRRELRDVTQPTRLATFAGGRAVLFDDRVEIDRCVIGLVPGATLTDVVVTGAGRSGVVYLSVSGPDGSRSLRLKPDEADDARHFAAAVRDAAGRVHDVQAERDRRIQELGTRVAELTAGTPRRPGRDAVLVGDVVGGPGEPGPADPLVDDVPDPEHWPSRAERDAARAAASGAGADAVHLVTDVPGPFVEESGGGTAPAKPPGAKPPKAAKRTKPPKAARPPRRRGRRKPREARAPREPRRLRRPLAALLGVLLVVGGTAGAAGLLRDRGLPRLTGSGDPAAPERPAPEAPDEPEAREPGPAPADEPAADPAEESALARAAAAVRKRLGRAGVDVLDVVADGGTLTIDVRQRDPGSMMRQTGQVFADVHASGADPRTTVLQHYAMVRDPVTGQERLGVVGVYEVTREQGEEIDFEAWGDISWDSFLTYRNEDWQP
jgi:hypothetical protein